MAFWGDGPRPDGKIIFGLMIGTVVLEVFWYMWKQYSTKPNESGDNSHASLRRESGHRKKVPVVKNTVLFFPDAKVACRRQFTTRNGCNLPNCHFSHDSRLSYSRLMRVLSSATHSIDVCVFCLTCQELVQILGNLVDKHLRVRVITDSDQRDALGSQVGALLTQGIHVRCDNTAYLMHHKFIVIDEKTLVTGSFNWTRQAITGNFENVCITSHSDLVQPYMEEFEKLWKMFAVDTNFINHNASQGRGT